jgi:predicted dehydrogenase
VPDARLAGVADRREIRAEVADRLEPECRRFDSLDALIASGCCRALIVATPPDTHVELAAQALRACLPVLVEKPIALSLDEAETLRPLCGAPHPFLMPAFNRRHWQPARELRRLIARRPAGPRATARLMLRTDLDAWAPIEAGADPLDDLGCHQLDLLRYLFGREIVALGARWNGVHEIHIRVQLEGGDEAECSALHGGSYVESVEVRLGSERCSIHSGSERVHREGTPVLRRPGLASLARGVWTARRGSASSYAEQLRTFCAAVRGRRVPRPDLEDGLATLRATLAARQSARRGGCEVVP